MSPPMKEYMYNCLQTKMGNHDLSELFHYKLSTTTRNNLLKILNPQHQAEHIKNETITDAQAKAKANKTMELSIQGNETERKRKNLWINSN